VKDPGEILIVRPAPFLQMCLGNDPPVILRFQILVIAGLYENSVEGIPCFKTDANRILIKVTGLYELLDLVVCHTVLLIFLQSTTFGLKRGQFDALFHPHPHIYKTVHMHDFLLYGAYGYTARLIARMASAYDINLLLAGRNEDEIRRMEAQTGFPGIVLDLNDHQKLDEALKTCGGVIHAAGPFKDTLKPMVEACIRTGRHYLDINGDIRCFEEIRGYNEAAKTSGVMLLPGAGFDVVPTDCLARAVADRLPDAVSLKIAFASLGSSLSHGTATTMAGKLGEGGMIRKEGKIIRRPFGEHAMEVDFGSERLFTMSIPWGDVSTAWHTTGISNIETFTHVKPSVYRIMKWQGLFNPFLRTSWFRNLLRKRIDRQPAGPNDGMRASARSLAWAEVLNQRGDRVCAWLSGPEVYDMTSHAALIIASRVKAGDIKPGYQTPAGMYGADLVLDIPGVVMHGPEVCPG
jgi:short subunit dehydrogenase-like uncharacterized protein